jgi:hypothetical protein
LAIGYLAIQMTSLATHLIDHKGLVAFGVHYQVAPIANSQFILAIGYWLLAIGYWLFGYTNDVIGCPPD